MHLSSSYNNVISNVNASENSDGGITIESFSNGNNFTNITALNTYYGISLTGGSNNNIFSNLSLSGESVTGLYLLSSTNNIFRDVNVTANRNYGIDLSYSSNNNLALPLLL